jgi:hypothetical protein
VTRVQHVRTLALAALLLGIAAAEARPGTRVGFAVRDITPTRSLSGICLGGYDSCTCRQATGVADHIYARAIVISGTGTNTTVALASLDLVGASNRVTRRIVKAVNASGSLLPAENVIIAETHSHATPDLVGLWGKVPQAYRDFVVAQTAAAIREAVANQVDARLTVSRGRFDETSNRRGWPETDRDLVVLDAHAIGDGARIATLVNFASHPTVLGSANRLISRDWAGAMIDRMEASLGAGRVMFVNGAHGDALPKTDVTGGTDDLDRARRYGEAVAERALAALSAEQLLIGDEVVFSRQAFTQCVTNQDLLLADLVGCMDFDLKAGWGCPLTGVVPPKKLSSQVSYLRLGREVQAAIVPGEALTRMAIDGVGAPGFAASSGSLKSVMHSPAKMIFGLAGDFLGYFVPRDEWNKPKEGRTPANRNYEEGLSLGGDQADRWLRDRIKALIQKDW